MRKIKFRAWDTGAIKAVHCIDWDKNITRFSDVTADWTNLDDIEIMQSPMKNKNAVALGRRGGKCP